MLWERNSPSLCGSDLSSKWTTCLVPATTAWPDNETWEEAKRRATRPPLLPSDHWMIRSLEKMIYVGSLKLLNEATRWQRILLCAEKKSLKISEGCKHEGESCGIKGTVHSTGFRAGSFPCCSEQWMADNWEAKHHHHDYISFKPVLLQLDLSCPTSACDWPRDLSRWNTAWK